MTNAAYYRTIVLMVGFSEGWLFYQGLAIVDWRASADVGRTHLARLGVSIAIWAMGVPQ